MNANKITKLLNISSLLTSAAALIFICFSIFGAKKKKAFLTSSLGCACLSNILIIIRNQINLADDDCKD